ncbi:MAG: hypothetical protein A3B74_02625 [Candidatus Kerfeldbacteria bacterium RIFCSPHIGHO2_02_FULL_42_14]|uniref:Peptidase M50 domain-containing protein n=1 Tax=Candidatus Kerfeldbacteria bacterium RIFCSPHIGHO2_02_FULL_42_14 TaxID=1798540 RepID=A0A1G2ARY6_9BACT|nr:MAG: hypothetical protein A3B74_02625 [Candidatus Kerfeldbacteria bacterium RIFCSPHIGHO2_02_FULL_42_14]OGY80435.1 MAG: hypothetical protein A3E60_05245 [Candidatus Kerfeldbacteria bacterium RIFCSPHIGHO2_12_FULL_42_13]OGY83865.1 MAG: hypothetical protein A3I91_04770 [Candidatus Kerfeldbacteria bacterium RIFCSPLOWO2_02_FULL_42_19]OGY86596.1 MAG: hypothetical protein A3G01_05060 [Candidatus Kerfeldbacteria bacterium RIFCSPLOWO2_12_FULL_43_9]
MGLTYLFSEPSLFLIWILAVIFGITIHEFSHALAGHLQGDRTAEQAGRLTLNPLAHVDYLGLILLILVGFGWGKPVPFNPYALRNKRFGPALVGLAGPFANLIAVIIFAFALKLLWNQTELGQGNLLLRFILSLLQINLVLLLFNLIPIPPLDGSKLLYSFLPYSKNHIIEFLERYGAILLLVFIIVGGSLLQTVISFVYNFIIERIVLGI